MLRFSKLHVDIFCSICQERPLALYTVLFKCFAGVTRNGWKQINCGIIKPTYLIPPILNLFSPRWSILVPTLRAFAADVKASPPRGRGLEVTALLCMVLRWDCGDGEFGFCALWQIDDFSEIQKVALCQAKCTL